MLLHSPFLSSLQLARLFRALLHDIVRLLIRPKLKVSLPISGFADLPRHPRNSEVIEHSNVVGDLLRLLLAGGAEFLEQHELVSFEGVLKRNGALRAELFDAAVGVHVDNIESIAGPIFGYV
jgi:hypothetical protein